MNDSDVGGVGGGGEVPGVGPLPSPLGWKFSLVFGGRAAGKEVQEGLEQQRRQLLKSVRRVCSFWWVVMSYSSIFERREVRRACWCWSSALSHRSSLNTLLLRLKVLPKAYDMETKKLLKQMGILIAVLWKTEIYAEEDEKLLGDYETIWTGLDDDGGQVYDVDNIPSPMQVTFFDGNGRFPLPVLWA